MTVLSKTIKAEIVLRLAQFGRAADIAREIEAEFGVTVDRFQIRTYDPTKHGFAAGDRWRSLFEQVRDRYLKDMTAIPISQKAYRLNDLQRTYDRASGAGNLVLANATLEQAAREVGGALTNTRELALRTDLDAYTPAERRAAFTEIVRKAMTH